MDSLSEDIHCFLWKFCMWLNMSWREKLFQQLVMQKMKHFTH